MAGLTSLFVTRDGSSDGTTPKGARHALGGLLLQAGDALLNARKGVLMDNGSANVVTGTAGMSFDIRAAVFSGQSSTAQGPWVGANDATVNVVTDAAPGSNSRYDIICVRQHLVAGDGGVDSDVELEFFVEQGVVAASPSVPATPSGAVKLAEALITAGMVATNTATITQKFDWTVARGGVLPIFSAAQLASLTPHEGQVIYDDTVTPPRLKVWNGSAWVTDPPQDSVFTDVTFSGSWTNFGAPYEEVSYAKFGDIVRLRGLLKHAVTSTTGTVFTLPVGYRPAKSRRFVVDAAGGQAVCVLANTGVFQVAGYQNGGNAGTIGMDLISFDILA